MPGLFSGWFLLEVKMYPRLAANGGQPFLFVFPPLSVEDTQANGRVGERISRKHSRIEPRNRRDKFMLHMQHELVPPVRGERRPPKSDALWGHEPQERGQPCPRVTGVGFARTRLSAFREQVHGKDCRRNGLVCGAGVSPAGYGGVSPPASTRRNRASTRSRDGCATQPACCFSTENS